MKKYCTIVLTVLVLMVILLGGRSAKKTTTEALDAMYENDASKFVSLLSDEATELLMTKFDLESKKLLVNKLEKDFENMQTRAEEKYGKKWKYKIKIIDSYEYIPSENSEYFSQFKNKKLLKVAYEINYTGKGMFKEKNGSENGKIQLVKQGGKWCIAYLE